MSLNITKHLYSKGTRNYLPPNQMPILNLYVICLLYQQQHNNAMVHVSAKKREL